MNQAVRSHTIPIAWKPLVRFHTGGRDYLEAGDFPPDKTVIVQFEDGSMMMFRYAFVLYRGQDARVAVFTEHCGYYFFSTANTRIDVVTSYGGS